MMMEGFNDVWDHNKDDQDHLNMVMMSCRMMLLLKTSPEADDGGLGGGGDDMRAADRFFLPPLPTGTTAKYL